MGMYNYLNGEQIKCFPVPMVYIDNGEKGHVSINSMGGLLNVYNLGDSVPYRSNIYNYGKDFMVFDYRGFEGVYTIHFIKNGKVSTFYTLDTLPSLFPLVLVIDNYGQPLNIKSRNDFIEIVEDCKKYIEDIYFKELKEVRVPFDNYIESIRDGVPNISLKRDYELGVEKLKKRTVDIFRKKWYLDNTNVISNNIGWLVDMLLNGLKCQEEADIILELYKDEARDFNQEVSDYKEWVKDLYSSEQIDNLLKIKK